MSHLIATWLVRVVTGYLAAGTLFAVPFVVWGVGRLDPVAERGTLGFRLLILPGVAMLWPLLLFRLVRGVRTPPEERNAHRNLAREGDRGGAG